jgi:PAS domain S-box-containing protein
MSKTKATYQQLETRLAVAESIVKTLRNHEVDAVVGEENIAFLLVREVEEALRVSDAGFRAMFQLAGVGMIQAETPDFHFTKVNQKFCEIAGYPEAELLTKTYIGLTHPDDRQRDMTELARVLRGEADSWSIEKRCVRKDGSLIWVAVHGAVLRDDTGRAVRIMAMISDLTASKQAEQKLRDAESAADNGKPLRRKKAASKKARESARNSTKKSSDKPRLKRR